MARRVAALRGGSLAEVGASLAPLGPVYQAGTLSGNPLATAAGLAALDLLDDDLYAELGRRAARLGDGLRAALEQADVPIIVPLVGPRRGQHVSPPPPGD